jgi:hypothetical protein
VKQVIDKNKSRGLDLNDGGYVKIELEYCRYIVTIIQDFFSRIFEETGFGPAE